MKYYPVNLRLSGKNVLIVGGGRIAERKIKALLSYGASVETVAPDATPAILRWVKEKKVFYRKRGFFDSDAKGRDLIIAATCDKCLNKKVVRSALKRKIWVNAVDQARLCGFITPAVIRKKGFVVSVSTDAKNPKASKALKDFLKRKIDEFDIDRY